MRILSRCKKCGSDSFAVPYWGLAECSLVCHGCGTRYTPLTTTCFTCKRRIDCLTLPFMRLNGTDLKIIEDESHRHRMGLEDSVA